MSIPGSLVVSKIRYPETEEWLPSGQVTIPQDERPPINILEAFANGALFGLRIAATIATTVLCIIALVACIDGFLSWWGQYLSINDFELTLDVIMGYLCYPIAFLIGASREHGHILRVGCLIGVKLITNEFVAYQALQTNDMYGTLFDRSQILVTYALCGFASLGALGIQIGVLSQIAPGRSSQVSQLAVSAASTGAVSTWIGACIAGLITI